MHAIIFRALINNKDIYNTMKVVSTTNIVPPSSSSYEVMNGINKTSNKLNLSSSKSYESNQSSVTTEYRNEEYQQREDDAATDNNERDTNSPTNTLLSWNDLPDQSAERKGLNDLPLDTTDIVEVEEDNDATDTHHVATCGLFDSSNRFDDDTNADGDKSTVISEVVTKEEEKEDVEELEQGGCGLFGSNFDDTGSKGSDKSSVISEVVEDIKQFMVDATQSDNDSTTIGTAEESMDDDGQYNTNIDKVVSMDDDGQDTVEEEEDDGQDTIESVPTEETGSTTTEVETLETDETSTLQSKYTMDTIDSEAEVDDSNTTTWFGKLFSSEAKKPNIELGDEKPVQEEEGSVVGSVVKDLASKVDDVTKAAVLKPMEDVIFPPTVEEQEELAKMEEEKTQVATREVAAESSHAKSSSWFGGLFSSLVSSDEPAAVEKEPANEEGSVVQDLASKVQEASAVVTEALKPVEDIIFPQAVTEEEKLAQEDDPLLNLASSMEQVVAETVTVSKVPEQKKRWKVRISTKKIRSIFAKKKAAQAKDEGILYSM